MFVSTECACVDVFKKTLCRERGKSVSLLKEYILFSVWNVSNVCVLNQIYSQDINSFLLGVGIFLLATNKIFVSDLYAYLNTLFWVKLFFVQANDLNRKIEKKWMVIVMKLEKFLVLKKVTQCIKPLHSFIYLNSRGLLMFKYFYWLEYYTDKE